MDQNTTKQFSRMTGISVEDIKKIQSKQGYKIFLINNKYILSEKKNMGEGSRVKMYKALNKFGIPTPTEIAFWQTPAKTYSVEKFLSGVSIKKLPHKIKVSAYLQLGALSGKINKIYMTGYGPITLGFSGKLPSWAKFVDRFKNYEKFHKLMVPNIISNKNYKTILKLVPTVKERNFQPCLLHGDIKEKNILCSKKGEITGILDWESAISGDPLLEYANHTLWEKELPYQKYLIQGYLQEYNNKYNEKHLDAYRIFTAFITLNKLYSQDRFEEVDFLPDIISKICKKYE